MAGFVLWIINVVSWILRQFGIRRSIAFGRFLGTFTFHVLRVRRGVVVENIARAFPEKSLAERREIATGCYRQLGRIVMEALLLPRLTADEIQGLVRFHNVELIDQAFAAGKGVIVCLGHMGNWELLGFEGARRGYTFWAITKTLKGAVNQRLHETRKKAFRELPPSGSFERGLEVIRNNEALALIIDQHRGGEKAVIIDFFKRPASTSPSPALFALRTGAPVVTMWMTLGADDVYDVTFAGPFPVPDAPSLAEQLQLHTQLIADDLEKTIRQHPTEWFWVHRRWKVPEKKADPTPSTSERSAA